MQQEGRLPCTDGIGKGGGGVGGSGSVLHAPSSPCAILGDVNEGGPY